VKSQIEMAIRARLQFSDPVSAMTLAGAAERVLSDLSEHNEWGDDALSIKLFIQKFAKGNEKAAAEILRKPINTLKHADRDPNVHPAVDYHWLETLLMMTVREFRNQSGTMTPVMHAFRVWCAANGGDWGVSKIMSDDEINGLREMYRGWSDSEIFLSALAYFESKSLIPNPKSLANPSTDQ